MDRMIRTPTLRELSPTALWEQLLEIDNRLKKIESELEQLKMERKDK